MALNLKNILFRFYLKQFFPPDFSASSSLNSQKKIFKKILLRLRNTQLGRDFKLGTFKVYDDFSNSVPVTRYDFYDNYIEKIRAGEQNVMTPDSVLYFGKTAGTTSGKSKLIPITRYTIYNTHLRGTFFGLSRLHSQDKTVDILSHKNFVLTGGVYEKLSSGITVADISAILMLNVPLPFRTIYVPSVELITNPSWEYKLNKVAEIVSKADVGTISGIPTWHLAVMSKIRDEIHFDKLNNLWKNLRIFFHGGVSFEPYRKHFSELLGRNDFIFYEIYNATEGFFGIQASLQENDLLLLTDTEIFYEFIPFNNYDHSKAIPLSDVKAGIPYVLLITASNGLLRYEIGDVITFTSCNPYKFKITGRTQEYINAFGEDLLLSNVENALMKTNAKFDCHIKEYNVAPLYININTKGRMQFLIEFIKPPANPEQYALELDQQLQKENSNYAQKRNNDLALVPLEIIVAQPGVFYKWLELKGKLGGQNKIPRLVNNRKVIEELIALNGSI